MPPESAGIRLSPEERKCCSCLSIKVDPLRTMVGSGDLVAMLHWSRGNGGYIVGREHLYRGTL